MLLLSKSPEVQNKNPALKGCMDQLDEQYLKFHIADDKINTYGGDRRDHLSDLDKQKDKCALCATRVYFNLNDRAGNATAQLDHCHASGEFRGWLCTRCNHMLGHAKDNPEVLRKAADYIDAHRKRSSFWRFVNKETKTITREPAYGAITALDDAVIQPVEARDWVNTCKHCGLHTFPEDWLDESCMCPQVWDRVLNRSGLVE